MKYIKLRFKTESGFFICNVGTFPISREILFQEASDTLKRRLESGQSFDLWTGLIDKNGQDIFENDLVKTDSDHITSRLASAAQYERGEIVWRNGGFHVCQQGIGSTPISDFVACQCCPCGLEVIGHTYAEIK